MKPTLQERFELLAERESIIESFSAGGPTLEQDKRIFEIQTLLKLEAADIQGIPLEETHLIRLEQLGLDREVLRKTGVRALTLDEVAAVFELSSSPSQDALVIGVPHVIGGKTVGLTVWSDDAFGTRAIGNDSLFHVDGTVASAKLIVLLGCGAMDALAFASAGFETVATQGAPESVEPVLGDRRHEAIYLVAAHAALDLLDSWLSLSAGGNGAAVCRSQKPLAGLRFQSVTDFDALLEKLRSNACLVLDLNAWVDRVDALEPDAAQRELWDRANDVLFARLMDNAEEETRKRVVRALKRIESEDSKAVESLEASDTRSVIYLSSDFDRVVVQTVSALGKLDDVYQRHRQLVTLHRNEILPIRREALVVYVSRAARFRKFKGDEKECQDVKPPSDIIGAVHALQIFNDVRMLEGISFAPFMRYDGSICQSNGYDPASRMFCDTGELIDVPERPTPDDVRRSKEIVDDLLVDFPFETPEDCGVAVAAFLTPIARNAIRGQCPAKVFRAPEGGSGKGLLVKLVSIVATGREPAVQAHTDDDNEMRKRITAVVLAGTPIAVIDNIPNGGEFGTASFDALLTTGRWSDRLLGQNTMIEGQAATFWMITGNNIQPKGDLQRRTLFCRLDPRVARPQDRHGFRHENLEDFVRANRSTILGALLTLLRHSFINNLRPTRRISSFEAWSDLVLGCIEHVWQLDLVKHQRDTEVKVEADADGLGNLLIAWARAFPNGAKPGRAVEFAMGSEPDARRLREALLGLIPRPSDQDRGVPSREQIGRMLVKHEKRVVQRWRFKREAARSKTTIWRVVVAANDTPLDHLKVGGLVYAIRDVFQSREFSSAEVMAAAEHNPELRKAIESVCLATPGGEPVQPEDLDFVLCVHRGSSISVEHNEEQGSWKLVPFAAQIEDRFASPGK